MDPKAVADSFSSKQSECAALDYLKQQGTLDILNSCIERNRHSYPATYCDLARLHQAIRARRVFTILEFGLGFSTVVMADALLKNSQEWSALNAKPKIRNSTLFQLHSVDASEIWIQQTQNMIPERLRGVVSLHYSEVKAGTFQDCACHFYEAVPDVVPDFIYLDGPHPATVTGAIGGLSWRNPDRVVMSGDILRMESHLLPGTLVVVDGRTANARFLSGKLYRKWQSERSIDGDVTVFELQEMPLGSINRDTLHYCLGERALSW